jgi:hypothetical protein
MVPPTYVAEADIEIRTPESDRPPPQAYPSLTLDTRPSVAYLTMALQTARLNLVAGEAAASLVPSISRGDLQRSTSIDLDLQHQTIVISAVDRTEDGAAVLASAFTASFEEFGVPRLEERIEQRLEALHLRIDKLNDFLARSREGMAPEGDATAEEITSTEDLLERYADSLLFFESVQAGGISLHTTVVWTSRFNPTFWQNAIAVWLYLSGGLWVLNRWRAGELGG